MSYSEYVKKTVGSMSVEEAEEIYGKMTDSLDFSNEETKELYNELITSAIEYAGIRSGWNILEPEERAEKDRHRTACHDAYISNLNIFGRYFNELGLDNSWRQQIGDDRKRIGDFACYIALFNGLGAR